MRVIRMSLTTGVLCLFSAVPFIFAQQSGVLTMADLCPFDDAVQIQMIESLKALGVTEQGFNALVEAGEVKENIRAICLDEINLAKARPDRDCEVGNAKAVTMLASYINMAHFLFILTGDDAVLRSNIRTLLEDYLQIIPRRCWFQGVDMPRLNQPPPVVDWQGITAVQCAQIRANYEACKAQSNQAVNRCASNPSIHNCASSIPVCALPPC